MKLGMIDPNTNDINTDTDLDIGSTLARLEIYKLILAIPALPGIRSIPNFALETCILLQ